MPTQNAETLKAASGCCSSDCCAPAKPPITAGIGHSDEKPLADQNPG